MVHVKIALSILENKVMVRCADQTDVMRDKDCLRMEPVIHVTNVPRLQRMARDVHLKSATRDKD